MGLEFVDRTSVGLVGAAFGTQEKGLDMLGVVDKKEDKLFEDRQIVAHLGNFVDAYFVGAHSDNVKSVKYNKWYLKPPLSSLEGGWA